MYIFYLFQILIIFSVTIVQSTNGNDVMFAFQVCNVLIFSVLCMVFLNLNNLFISLLLIFDDLMSSKIVFTGTPNVNSSIKVTNNQMQQRHFIILVVLFKLQQQLSEKLQVILIIIQNNSILLNMNCRYYIIQLILIL